MSGCKHKWIGDTCTECGVNWGVNAKYTMAKQEEEIFQLKLELAETDNLIRDVHNALLSSRRRKAEAAREMVPKDDLLLTQGMLQQSREHVKQEEAKTRKWQKMAEKLYKVTTAPTCSQAHHEKRDQHKLGEPCPVENRALAVYNEYFKLREEYAE